MKTPFVIIGKRILVGRLGNYQASCNLPAPQDQNHLCRVYVVLDIWDRGCALHRWDIKLLSPGWINLMQEFSAKPALVSRRGDRNLFNRSLEKTILNAWDRFFIPLLLFLRLEINVSGWQRPPVHSVGCSTGDPPALLIWWGDHFMERMVSHPKLFKFLFVM